MPVTDAPPRNDYIGEASTADYDFDFQVLDGSHLAIYEDGVAKTIPTHYTVTLNDDRTGSVHRVAGDLPEDSTLAIVSEPDIEQPVQLTRAKGYRPDIVERCLDRVTLQQQSIFERVRHCFRFPQWEDYDGTLPSAVARANKVVGFDSSGNMEMVDRDELGGSGGSSSGSLIGYDITATEFGAIGDGSTHPLSEAAADAFNEDFFNYGCHDENAMVAGDETDFAGTQCALWKAGWTGHQVHAPPGTFRINRPIRQLWTASPDDDMPNVPLVCRFTGSGRATVFKGYGIEAGRAVFEFLGESNTYAVNLEISHMQVEQDSTCEKYSFCMRLGDGYGGISLHRVIAKGANALALRVASSVTYAQICFSATQCQFWSNWERRWGDDDVSMDVYSVVPESLGSYWDLAKFDSCFFWGQVDCRAFNLKFESSMFINQVERATPYGATVYLGTASWDNCYFEDHLVGIATDTATAGVPITNIAIRNCHFSSVNNSGTPANAQSSIQCARNQAEHGPVLIENCRFGGTATYSDIDLYGPITVTITGCCRPFLPGINTAPSVTTAGDVRLIQRNPNGELAFDVYSFLKVRIECADFIGPSTFHQDVNGGASLTISNADTGNVATAALVAESDDVTASLVAYHTAHPILAGYAVVLSSDITVPVAVAPGGLIRFQVDNTWCRAIKSVNGGYGFAAENTNAGASAYTFVYGYNGAVFGGFHVYGANHFYANETHLGSFSPTYHARLVAGGDVVAKLDASDRRLKMRDNGTVGGLWYIQTVTQTFTNSTTETPITTGGIGTLTIPANTLQVGSVLELEAYINETAAVNTTYTYRWYANAVDLGGALSYAVLLGSTNLKRLLKLRLTVQALGVTGSAVVAQVVSGALVTIATVVIDTTAAQTIYLAVDADVADVGNIVTCPQADLKVTL